VWLLKDSLVFALILPIEIPIADISNIASKLLQQILLAKESIYGILC
jgi:hypothetical protein